MPSLLVSCVSPQPENQNTTFVPEVEFVGVSTKAVMVCISQIVNVQGISGRIKVQSVGRVCISGKANIQSAGRVCISGRGNAMYSQLYRKVKVYHPNWGHPQSFMPSTECWGSCFALNLWCFGIPELLLSEEEISILLESLEKSALCLFLEGPRARSGFYRWVFTITFLTENTTLMILYFMCAGAPRTGAVLSHSCVRWEGNQTGPSTSASVFSFLSSL